MIFDLIAANGGGRKYLFHNGEFAEKTGGLNHDLVYASVTVDVNGLTFISTSEDGVFTSKAWLINSIDLSRCKKVCFLFDFVDHLYGGNIYITSSKSLTDYLSKSVAQASFGENTEPFIVELDVSAITGNYFVFFTLHQHTQNAFYQPEKGKGYRIRSIWYR